jgi:hypothetical protein
MQRRNVFDIPSRALFCTGAIGCFCLAFALTPSDVRSQLSVRDGLAFVGTPPNPAPRTQPVLPVRDAFAAPASIHDDVPAANHPAAPARTAPEAVLPVTRVTAIVTGDRPTAIVETGAAVRAVSVGDPLDGSRVSSIDDGAIELADGSRLVLIQASSAP